MKLTKQQLTKLKDQKECDAPSSFDDAYEMDGGITSTKMGIKVEFILLESDFGFRGEDWHLVRQQLINCDGRKYDIITIQFLDGTERDVYFDITDWFGK